ncbi:hypothetical protein TNIN_66421 [Trichonephila inaurata madagascariensis]|uniref:Uncharacterized protein n=1 Tax=Trichonephila inaurata madagascariensis TaxID=2747483 RepID=A0A8X6ML03_9ARAC|nr:hypothetical protein TNIN_66421 [Trichonephila inaurata madagascariensis]
MHVTFGFRKLERVTRAWRRLGIADVVHCVLGFALHFSPPGKGENTFEYFSWINGRKGETERLLSYRLHRLWVCKHCFSLREERNLRRRFFEK